MPHVETSQLFQFIQKSPTAFHAIAQMQEELEKNGFVQLMESERWNVARGGKYYVIRNLSSLIAFRIPDGAYAGFMIMASHSDSPVFKIKTDPEMETEQYVRLNVEKYGGMIIESWLDRPLSVAGRLVVQNGDRLETRLVDIPRDLLLIPRLAIHMNREEGAGGKYNVQNELLPLYGGISSKGSFMRVIAEAAHVEAADVMGSELYLYNRMPGTLWGAQNEFISAPRLDDLQCAFSSLKGFLQSRKNAAICVHCVYDNEEVGSGTKQGAASTFLADTLRRIVIALGGQEEDYLRLLASSLMLSADNAHGVHPNYPAKADPVNRPRLNGGVVVKYSANQKYTTDAVSAALFGQICRSAQVPVQAFHNRSDMLGGSTLGNLSNQQVALNTVDIGLAQLAMHSSYETAGAYDTDYLIRAAAAFFETALTEIRTGTYRFQYPVL